MNINNQQERIERRKEVISLLTTNEQAGTLNILNASPLAWHRLKLLQLARASKEPIQVDIDLAMSHFPGRYVSQLVNMLETLQAIGLVKVTQEKGVTSYELDIKDETARELIDVLFS